MGSDGGGAREQHERARDLAKTMLRSCLEIMKLEKYSNGCWKSEGRVYNMDWTCPSLNRADKGLCSARPLTKRCAQQLPVDTHYLPTYGQVLCAVLHLPRYVPYSCPVQGRGTKTLPPSSSSSWWSECTQLAH